MKINNIEVTIMDFERLNHIITNTLKAIETDNVDTAKYMLEVLQKSIESNLIAECNSKQDIEIGDDVEVTYLGSNFKDEHRELFLGVKCYVDESNQEYLREGEYILQPKNYKDLHIKNWIFTKENLTLI